jgi:hypothetical protein
VRDKATTYLTAEDAEIAENGELRADGAAADVEGAAAIPRTK